MTSLIERARKLIPMGTMTSSKATCRFADGYGPSHILCGRGCKVWTVDNREFIDWAMGLGPVLLGHAHEGVNRAVADALGVGTTHTLSTEWEVLLAEKLNEIVPCAEMVRLLKTGSDATTAAVRLARAFTGRDRIVRCGYHGWHDWALNNDYREKKGIPQCVRDLTTTVPYNDTEALEDEFLRREVPAAFILEPVSLVAPYDWYLPSVRDLCTRYGVVLIFDEVITGIRMAPGGAGQYFDVKPDLACFGKGLANGFPLSAVMGRRDIMEQFVETHISGTYNGETASIRASLATLKALERSDFWTHQRSVGERLRTVYTKLIGDFGMEEETRILGLPHFTSIQWTNAEHGTLFQQEMMRSGILFSGSQFPCLMHTEVPVARTCQAYGHAMEATVRAIRDGTVASKLHAAVNQPVFRRH